MILCLQPKPPLRRWGGADGVANYAQAHACCARFVKTVAMFGEFGVVTPGAIVFVAGTTFLGAKMES